MNKEMLNKLRDLAIEGSKNSYSPYSQAKVGAALMTSDGRFYSGCNIENSSFGGTVCAERVAMFKAISERFSHIRYLYVYTQEGWPPCGLCRQVLSEFADPDCEIIIGDAAGKEEIKSFREIFPLAFTPEHMQK